MTENEKVVRNLKNIVAIHQANYLIWQGYLKKIFMADVFVILDNVQYSDAKELRMSKNSIKGANGKIDLRVSLKKELGKKINEVEICENGWRRKHLKSIEFAYKKAKHFNEVYPTIERLLTTSYKTLDELDIAITLEWVKRCKIPTKIMFGSQFEGIEDFRKEDLVIEICKRVGADAYYSGKGAREYQNEDDFKRNGIELIYQENPSISYEQLWGGFIPNLSAIDYFMNNGFKIPDEWKEERKMLHE